MLFPLAPLLLFELPQLLALLPFDVLRPEQPQRNHEEYDPHHGGSVRLETGPRQSFDQIRVLRLRSSTTSRQARTSAIKSSICPWFCARTRNKGSNRLREPGSSSSKLPW